MSICIQYKNTINYTDCFILATMSKLEVDKIVSFVNGFKRVPNITVYSAD